MGYSYTEKKRIRKSFSKRTGDFKVPYLLETQKQSYRKFLQEGIAVEDRPVTGLQAAFKSVFPIESYNGSVMLDFIEYRLAAPRFDVKECMQRGLVYCAPIYATLRLVIFEKNRKKKKIKDAIEQEVFLGDIPLMTDNGTFVINGTERVIVSQLHRSPGVLFDHDGGKTHASGKLLFTARIIPYRGSWLDMEFDPKDLFYVRIDRRRKIPATILLKSMGLSAQDILESFYDNDVFKIKKDSIDMVLVPSRLRGQQFEFDILGKDKKVVIAADKRITARHIKLLEKSNVKHIEVPESFCMVVVIEGHR